MNNNKDNDKRCSPYFNYEYGSCIALNLLVEMIKAYNKSLGPNDKYKEIKLDKTKELLDEDKYSKYLINEMNNRMKNVCDTQACWIEQGFIELMNEKAKNILQKYVFRPKGPEGQFTWLNTNNVSEVMLQYELNYPDFKYLGTVPMDFEDLNFSPDHNTGTIFKNLNFNDFLNKNIYRFGMVINLDNHNQSGSHWVALYFNLNKKQIYYYDSVGLKFGKKIVNFIKNIINNIGDKFEYYDIRYNKKRHQYDNSECGVYSMDFIVRILGGESFDNIQNNGLSPKDINKKRNIYFNNTNI